MNQADSNNAASCYSLVRTDINEASQSNTASNSSTADQSNKASISIIANQQNDCDESGEANFDGCVNAAGTGISSVSQSNTAAGSSIAVQTNDVSFSQGSDQQNDCDESGDGDNIAFCDHFIVSGISAIFSPNTASDSSAAGQTNSATLVQKAAQNSDCDKLGDPGDFEFCINRAGNSISGVSQIRHRFKFFYSRLNE